MVTHIIKLKHYTIITRMECIMKRKSLVNFLCVGALISFCLLTGCNNNQSNDVPAKESSQPATEITTDAPAQIDEESATEKQPTADETSIETMSISIQIVNMCGVDIGTFSVIDPANGEQINIDSIANEEIMSIDANWPVDTENFQWALYNQSGELCLEGSTDITGVTSRVLLVFTGDGNVENVESTVE